MKFIKDDFKRITYKGKIVLYKKSGLDRNGNSLFDFLVINKNGADLFSKVQVYGIKDGLEFISYAYSKKK